MSDINLTPEEEALLSSYNATAFDLLRMVVRKIMPCWLCMSDTARDEARESLRAFLAGRGHNVPTVRDAETFVEGHMRGNVSVVQRWREAELECKRGRAAGDPHAFFAG
jgi:hypothetical protein